VHYSKKKLLQKFSP